MNRSLGSPAEGPNLESPAGRRDEGAGAAAPPAWAADLPPSDAGDRRLRDRVAVVTGAGSSGDGIGNGRASAILMARHGAQVALLDRERGPAEETRAVILGEGGDALVVSCDVSQPDSCARAAETVRRRYGHVDVLMNNVGILGARGTAVEVDAQEWDFGMAVNLKSMMLMAKVCIPLMERPGRASIINVASIAGLEGGYPHLLYPTSKGAIIQMTRAMAAQHGPAGIRVNALAPGLVYTPMVAGEMTDELRKQRTDQSLLKTEGRAWDVAMAALFLASDESRWITGIVLPVDGGATAARVVYAAPPTRPGT